MEFLTVLWLPILLSAAIVFVLSFIIHMLLTYHKTDFMTLPNEDAVMEALRKFDIPRGDYFFPYAGSSKAMHSPEYIEKLNKGPVALMTVMEKGPFKMTKSLVLWFLFCVVISIFSAYIADRAVGPGGDYLRVFRFVGCSAFMGYSLALLQDSIWHKRNWGATLRMVFDGLVYALFTAGMFGWLWPR